MGLFEGQVEQGGQTAGHAIEKQNLPELRPYSCRKSLHGTEPNRRTWEVRRPHS